MKITKKDIEYVMSEARRIVSEQLQTQATPTGNSLISTKKRKDDIQSIIKKHELINIEQVGVNNKCFIGFCVKEQKWYAEGCKYTVYIKLFNSKKELVYSRTIMVENDQISTK